MFNGDKYVTKGVAEYIPLETQLIMWQIIETMRANEQEMDYLQVFELKQGINEQQIVLHRQEVPSYQKEFVFVVKKRVHDKIFVIDDGMYATMMLASEY